MRWASGDPTERTWVVFLHRLEHERQTKILDLCKEYNTDPRFAARVFERYKKWREGKPLIPPIDVIGALREIREVQERKQEQKQNG